MKKIILLLFLIISLLPSSSISASDKIDINNATLSQLDELTGIGPKYAQAIIDGRPFSSVDDLERIKGIGPKTLQKIKDQGLACVNCAASTTATASQTIFAPDPTLATASTGTPVNISATPTTTIIYSSGVFINEILPNPAGADETEEWIELYNSNNIGVDLSGWQIQDKTGTITTFSIPKDTKVLANSFLIFKRPQTNIMLNNDEDGINLLTPDRKIVDSITFSKAPLGQSYNKTANGWMWSKMLTPSIANVAIAAKPKTTLASLEHNNLPKTNNSVTNDGVELGLASLNKNAEKSSPWFLFFTTLAVTIILASVVLLIKSKFLQNHVRT